MKRLGLAVTVGIFGLGTGGALAANGDCTYSVTSSSTSPASLIFDNTLTAGPGESYDCVIAAPTFAPHPSGVIVLYSADYRGSVEDGDTAALAVQHDGGVDGVVLLGPHDFGDDSPLYRDYLTSDQNGTIGSIVTWSLSANSSAVADLNTIDYAEVGRTTFASVQTSIDQLAAGRTALVTHLNNTGDLLTGGNQPSDAPDNIAAFGAFGSYTFGATGHYNISDGFSVDGGVAYTSQSTGGSGATGALAAGAVRYLQPGADTFRPFGSIGFIAAPGLGMTFSRHYDDGSVDGATVVSSTSGSLGGIYFEGGVLVAPDPSNEIAFSARLMRNWLTVTGYSETFSPANLFPATVATSTGDFDTIKASAAWTTTISQDVDLTVTGAVGKTFSHAGVATNVAFVGPITGAAQDDFFAEYGARLGLKLTPETTADAFVSGVTGSTSGTHLQVGGGVHLQF